MRTLRILTHSIFTVLGGVLLFDMAWAQEFKDLLLYALMVYIIGFLLFSVIREIYLIAFPRYIGLLLVFGFYAYQFLTKNYSIFSIHQLVLFLTAASTILAFYFLINSIVSIPIKLQYRKIKTASFKRYYRFSSLFVLLVILLIIGISLIFKNDTNKIIKYSLAILILPFHYFNKNFIKGFVDKIREITNKMDWNLSFDQIGKLAKIKNFVFSKDKFISTGIYQMIDSDYRSTIKVMSAMQLANQLANEWDKKYAKLFVLDDYERGKITYNIVEQNDDGITVIDDYAVMYHFGNNSFMKDKIKRDESANLFLVKNGMPIAKFKINEKIADDKAELVNQLDYFGNTVLFNHGMKEDLGRDYFIVFDKVYPGVNEKRQTELLNELERKAPTAFISAKNPISAKNMLNIYVTSKNDVQTKENLLLCPPNKHLMIPQLVKLSKKIHTFFKYALLFSFVVQIFLLVFAVLNYDKLILILGVYISASILAEILFLYFKNKMIYLPDHPANLDHNHQAA